MKSSKLLMILTLTNAGLLVYQLSRPYHVAAKDVVPVLRARALEIVDENGRVRAELKVLPAQPTVKMPDGTTGFPEAVQLRLISSTGAPNVKLSAIEDGSGFSLGGQSAYVQVLARGTNPFLKIVNKDGQERTFKP